MDFKYGVKVTLCLDSSEGGQHMCQCFCDTRPRLMTEMNLCPCLHSPVESLTLKLTAAFLLFQVEAETVAEVRRRRCPPAPTAASCAAPDVPEELNSIDTSLHSQR